MKKRSLASLALGLLVAPSILGVSQVVYAQEETITSSELVATEESFEESETSTTSEEIKNTEETTSSESTNSSEKEKTKQDDTKESTESSTSSTVTKETNNTKEKEDTKEEKIEFPVTIDVLPSVTIEQGSSFNIMQGVRAYDHVAKKDVSNTVTYDVQEILEDGQIISHGTKLDTNREAHYFVKYSITTPNGTAFVYRQIVVIEADVYGFYQINIADFTLPKNADYQTAIMNRLQIRDKDDNLIPNSKVDIMIADYFSTSEVGVITVPISVVTEYNTFMETTVNINIVDSQSKLEIISENSLKVDLFSEFNPLDYAKAYGINANGDKVNLPVTVVSNNVDTTKEGIYSVVYSVTDEYNNTLTKEMKVTVAKKAIIDIKTPVIHATDKEMFVGEKLTSDIIMDWATFENAEGSFVGYSVIGEDIVVDALTSNLIKAGTYQIEYFVSPTSEFENLASVPVETVTKVITLTVKERKADVTPAKVTTPVNKTTQKAIENKVSLSKTLPQTGEKENNLFTFSFGVSMLLASFYIFKRKENEFEL
ncbi:immunoglobulin-like domain-containing protein [uncultured Vagococcus sp.]|jgi:LPXTG-motif cell wall-anchored protein|uniref:immunoglobulin-like domain-containing protein n=1 Tax=uncultured Vagococcus sp. TaxID=189676 RepID=UPI00258A6DD8|nr:immunoglobulin-like domain-containing protein [uncultured Vagococcus sp.]